MTTQKPLSENDFATSIEKKALRKIKARKNQDQSVWFGLGMFGLIGWSVAVPTLAGIALGLWIDKSWPSPISWTLTFMFMGVVLGCLNAWHWIKEEKGNE